MAAMIQGPRLMSIGGGAVKEAAGILERLGVKRPLIVSDPFMRDSGLLARLTDGLDAARIKWDLFAETVPDPTTTVVETGVGRLRSSAYDSLIAFGGGSPMDTAKAMSVQAAMGSALRELKVPKQADKSAVPVICIPTTAGTGSRGARFCATTRTPAAQK